MPKNDFYKFLIIDDEEMVLNTLKHLIERAFKDYQALTANDGATGLNIILNEKPDIVICDLGMDGMDGIQLLLKIRAREELNDIYFIILTASTNRDKRVEALEKGADDYISKPVTSDELAARLKSALRIVRMQKKRIEENELLIQLADELEKDIQDMTKLAVKFMQSRIPSSYEMLKNVAKASSWIAKQFKEFDEDEIRDIEIGGYLCQAGRIFLPDNLLKSPVLIDGQASHKLMYQIPVATREIVSSIRRFRNISKFLYHIYENFDGSGFPERLKSWQIPLESRIIRVALDYFDNRYNAKMRPRLIMNKIMSYSKAWYDYRAVVLLDQYVRTFEDDIKDSNERAVLLVELEEGMILTRDVITNSGQKLIPAGAVLKESTIEKILSHNSNDPILGNLYVRNY